MTTMSTSMALVTTRRSPVAHASADGLRVVIAGGGTGGHLFPGIAIAEALQSAVPSAQVYFLGARAGLEARVLPERGWPVWLLDLSRLRGLGLWDKVQSLARLASAVSEAAGHLRAFRPHAVIGVGGYAAGAGMLAAARLGFFRAIHEQNAVAGWTNRASARLAHRIYTSFPDTAHQFPASRVCTVGNPVRSAIEATRSRAASAPLADAALRILVVGGSQGAHFLNTSLPPLLAQVAPHRRLALWHQTGAADRDAVAAAYAAAGLDARVDAFVSDMPAAYAWADLAICRAGASTIAELCAVGLPAILVPFPHAAGDHQTANARVMADAGAAWLAPQATWNPGAWAEALAALDAAALSERSDRARSLAHPDAASALVTDLLTTLAERGRWRSPEVVA